MFLWLIAGMLSATTAQTDYTQFLVANLRPEPDKIAAFEAGLAAHNKKYHTADPYKAWVWSVQTGPGSGSYDYVMGPVTLAQMDARTTTPEHDADWNNNVLAHCDELGETNYWRWDPDIHYMPEGASNFSKSRLRFVTIRPGQADRYEEQIKKIAEVFKQKKYPIGYNVYWRFGVSQGPHAVVGLDLAKWADLDNEDTFVADFNSIHGAGAFDRFLEELDIAIDRSKTYDTLTEFMPALSSDDN
jgi:hypothetical protein